MTIMLRAINALVFRPKFRFLKKSTFLSRDIKLSNTFKGIVLPKERERGKASMKELDKETNGFPILQKNQTLFKACGCLSKKTL